MSKGKSEADGKGTKTERLYREWLTADQSTRDLIENSLTNICVSACRGLVPPVEWSSDASLRYRAWHSRYSARWKWCHGFVRRDLASNLDDCRHIARRCRLRLINTIDAAGRTPQEEYLADVRRDAKGRFKKFYRTPKPKEEPAPVKIVYQKYPG